MAHTPSPVQQKLSAIRQALRGSVLERESLIDGMMTALIAKEMLFVLGPPGTGKSKICEALCGAITGGEYFQYLLGKTSTPEELYGPFSLKGLQNDQYLRITKGKLPEAHVAFLDEIWKSNGAVLNTLLPIINERVMFNDGRKQIPLQMMVAASNEIPTSEELAAIYDRFSLRYVVEALRDDDNFRKMLETGRRKAQIPTISLSELGDAQSAAENLPVPSLTIEKMVELRRAVQEKEIFVSDRKFNQALSIAKAYAYLMGHSEVEVEDLTILENVLWHNPDQFSEIRTLVRKLCNPVGEVLHRHLDSANTVMIQVRSGKMPGMEAFQKLQVSKTELDEMNEKSPREDVTEAVNKIGEMCKTLSETLFTSRLKKK